MKTRIQPFELSGRISSMLKLVVVLVLASSALSSCRSRADAAKDAEARSAPEPATPLNPPVIDSKDLEVREENDLPYAKEIKQNYELTKGAKVNVRNFSGKLEIKPSDTNEAQVYLVRLSNDKQGWGRKITIDHSPEELTIRSERQERSAMFQMFGNRRSERQRAIVRIPQGTALEIEEVSGRVRVENIDGAISMEGVYGPIEVAGLSSTINVNNVHGRIGLSVKSLAKEGISVHDVNGAIDIALPEPINADVNVNDVNGRIDVDVPNLVTQGEKEYGRLNGKIGKGGPRIEIVDVNGRIKVQTLAKAQAAGASSPTPTPQMKSKIEKEIKAIDKHD